MLVPSGMHGGRAASAIGIASMSEVSHHTSAVELRLQARLAERIDSVSARHAQRDPHGVAAAKLPRTVQPVEVEADPPEADAMAP